MSDQSFRRKWNREEFQKIAHSRIQAVTSTSSKISQKQFKQLNPVDLKVGVSTANSKGSFYCDVCKFTCHDYNSYLEHINNWRHRKTVSQNPRKINPITVEGVRQLLDSLVESLSKNNTSTDTKYTASDVEESVLQREIEHHERKEKKRTAKKSIKDTKLDPQIQEMIDAGFDFVK